jgi:hypothetical protein
MAEPWRVHGYDMILFTLKEHELSTFRCSPVHLLPRLRTFHIQVLRAHTEREREMLSTKQGTQSVSLCMWKDLVLITEAELHVKVQTFPTGKCSEFRWSLRHRAKLQVVTILIDLSFEKSSSSLIYLPFRGWFHTTSNDDLQCFYCQTYISIGTQPALQVNVQALDG